MSLPPYKHLKIEAETRQWWKCTGRNVGGGPCEHGQFGLPSCKTIKRGSDAIFAVGLLDNLGHFYSPGGWGACLNPTHMAYIDWMFSHEAAGAAGRAILNAPAEAFRWDQSRWLILPHPYMGDLVHRNFARQFAADTNNKESK